MVVPRARALPLAAMVILVAAGQVMAATPLHFDWDKRADTTRGVATNSFGDVLAEENWPSAVPIVLDYEEEEAEVPTPLLAALRDELDQSTDPEAPEAAAFVRGLLGPLADLPLEQIPALQTTWVPLGSVLFGEECGTEVDLSGECVTGIDQGNSLCAGFACKRTTFQQLP